MRTEEFFQTAVERYRIKLARDAGQPAPWTTDPVFQQFRFCNVHREDDKTTQWFRDNVRLPLAKEPPLRLIKATVAFRTFNLISTGERILPILLRHGWHTEKVRKALTGVYPVITGAYMVRSPYGKTKLEGICEMMEAFLAGGYDRKLLRATTLQGAHEAILEAPYQGAFTAYEIVTDLRHTHLLGTAKDVMTWANPGPGALRGCQWVTGEHYTQSPAGREQMLHLMRQLLGLSRPSAFHWPEAWPQWEMREVEHWLCEFDKYKRAQAGEHMKRRFNGNPNL